MNVILMKVNYSITSQSQLPCGSATLKRDRADKAATEVILSHCLQWR